MHKPQTTLENKDHKSLWDYSIPIRRPYSVVINKKKRMCQSFPQITELKTREILEHCQRAEKIMEYQGGSDTSHRQNTWNKLEGSGKETARTGNLMK